MPYDVDPQLFDPGRRAAAADCGCPAVVRGLKGQPASARKRARAEKLFHWIEGNASTGRAKRYQRALTRGLVPERIPGSGDGAAGARDSITRAVPGVGGHASDRSRAARAMADATGGSPSDMPLPIAVAVFQTPLKTPTRSWRRRPASQAGCRHQAVQTHAGPGPDLAGRQAHALAQPSPTLSVGSLNMSIEAPVIGPALIPRCSIRRAVDGQRKASPDR